MTLGLTSIVIPTYQHGHVLADAIESALAQTARVEVIVVDDGSTDGTDRIHHLYPAGKVDWLWQQHAGPSAARNRGLEAALGEFVCFLDADDVIAPDKVERQLQAFTPDVGWILCDVRIEDAGKGTAQLASERYGYAGKNLGGWIGRLLEAGNFIPIHSPLVRASVLTRPVACMPHSGKDLGQPDPNCERCASVTAAAGGPIRFAETVDGEPEDWRFWQRVAAVARARYLPEVLATYRKQRTGRNRLPKAARALVPNIVQPLRLNLGCGTPNTRSWHPIDGLVNLDKSLGWRFEDGLKDFGDRSVAGITISHALMYAPLDRWPFVFSEFARVLEPGGVVRITEDDARNPASARCGGWKGSEPAVTLTDAIVVAYHLEGAGLQVHIVDATSTGYRDRSLVQAQHGEPPNVFFVEGVKLEGVLFSPHNDDEALFASFTILRHRPHVVICFPSSGDYGETSIRETESHDACTILGAASVEQWQGGDLAASMRAYDEKVHPARVWAPHLRASHPDHRAVAQAAAEVFGSRVVRYHTYDEAGKVREGQPVEHEPDWVLAKLRALARYESQIKHPRANVFFNWDLAEYIETEAS